MKYNTYQSTGLYTRGNVILRSLSRFVISLEA